MQFYQKKVWWIGLIIKFIRLFCYYVIIFNNQCVNNLYLKKKNNLILNYKIYELICY